MAGSRLDDQLIMRCLLGEASEEEEQQLEERYFSNDEDFELMLTIEEELIDAYVSGDLSPQQRERFESRFLSSPRRRQRVAFFQALSDSVQRAMPAGHPERIRERQWWRRAWPGLWSIPRPVTQVLLAASVLLLVAAGSWSILQRQHLRSQLAQMEVEQTALRTEGERLRRQVEEQRKVQQQLSEALAQENTRRSSLESARPQQLRTIASFILTPGAVRSPEQGRALLIRPGTDQVQLQLDLDGQDYARYRVAVRTPEDVEIWSQDGLQARATPAGRAVMLSLPANLLQPGDYVVLLRAVTAAGDIEETGQYSFKTIR